MKNVKTARRYATALMQIAVRQNRLEAVHEDLQAIHALIAGQPDFKGFLINPLIKSREKRQIIEATLKESLSADTLDFLYLLCDKRRENILQEIIEAFNALYEEHIGEVNVEVTSVIDLNPEQIRDLTSRLQTMLGRKPKLTFRRDAGLIAGFMVRVGDTVIDGSVKHQLDKLKERFLTRHLF